MAEAAAGPKRDESDVYDRQIRLWGAEAQEKISKAKVLYIHLTGVSSEVLKNLVLAGVRPVLCDGRPYPDAILDTPSFFIDAQHRRDKKIKYASVAHAVKDAVEELNPLLGSCQILYDDHGAAAKVEDLPDDLVGQYDMVVASHLGMAQAARIADATTRKGGKFYLVDCFGLSGVSVLDLGPHHTYRVEQGKSLSEIHTVQPHVALSDIWKVPLGDLTSPRVDKTPPSIWVQYRSILEYEERTNEWPTDENADDFVQVVQQWIADDAPQWKDLPSLTSEALRKLASVATAELSPVCAVLGGVIGNEVIKAISGKGEPANNTLLFDGLEGKCRNVLVQPKSH